MAGPTAKAEPQSIDEVLHQIQGMGIVLPKTARGAVRNNKVDRYADLEAVNKRVLSELNKLNTIWVCVPTFAGGEFVLSCALKHIPSGTSVDALWPIGKSDQQKMGSGVTYGRRYSLLAITGIAAKDDDDDGNASPDRPSRLRTDESGSATAQRGTPPVRPERSRPEQRPPAPEPVSPAPTRAANMSTNPQLGKLAGELKAIGITERPEALRVMGNLVGRSVESSKELTKAEAHRMIEALIGVRELHGADAVLHLKDAYEATADSRPSRPATGKPQHTSSAREALGIGDGAAEELAPWDGALPT